MGKMKDTPNLPASSRMQMPTTGGTMGKPMDMKNGKATASIKQGGVATKVVGSAKGHKSMKGNNPYC